MIVNAITALSNTVVIVFVAWCLGGMVLKHIRTADQDKLDVFSLRAGVGLALIIFGLSLASVFQVLYQKVLLGVFYITAFVNVKKLRITRSLWPKDKFSKIVASLLTCYLFLIFLNTMNYPVLGDAVQTHLPLVHDIIENDGMRVYERSISYGFGIGTFLLYALGSSLPVLYFPAMMHFAFLVLCVISMIEYGYKLSGQLRVGLLAALVSSSIFEVAWISMSPTYDLSVLFFQLISVFFCVDLVRASRPLQRSEIIVIALLVAAAFTTKLYGIFIVFFITVVLAIRLKGSMPRFRHFLIAATVIALYLLPFVIPVWVNFGSPLFPKFHANALFSNAGLYNPAAPPKDLLGFLNFPTDMTFMLHNFKHIVGPIFLATVPLILTKRTTKPGDETMRLLLVSGLWYIAVWYWNPMTWFRLRYFLLPFFIMSPAVARWLLSALFDDRRKLYMKLAVVVLLLVQTVPSWAFALQKSAYFRNKPGSSMKSYYRQWGEKGRTERQTNKIISHILSRDQGESRIFAYDGEWYPLHYFGEFQMYSDVFLPLKGIPKEDDKARILEEFDTIIFPRTDKLSTLRSGGVITSCLSAEAKSAIHSWFDSMRIVAESEHKWERIGHYEFYEVFVKKKS